MSEQVPATYEDNKDGYVRPVGDPRLNIEGVSETKIRELRPEDIDSVVTIMNQWVRDAETGEIIDTEVIEIAQKMQESVTGSIDDRLYLVAEQGGSVVGVMGVARPSELMQQYASTENPLEVINAFVSAEHQGSGVGSQLLEEASSFAQYAGATELMVNSGPRYKNTAWDFYDAKFGTRLTTLKDHYGPGLDAPVWSRSLTQ